MMSNQLDKQSEIPIRNAALAIGVVFLLLGLAGFVPGLTFVPDASSAPTDQIYPGPGYGYVLGLFPTNYFHSAIGILVGVWGLAAFTSVGGAVAFHQIFTVLYVLQAVLGLLPGANTLFGMMPLYGSNVFLSLILAAITFSYGFIKPGQLAQNTGLSVNFR
jgi:Domain of unknown function (DUF4383)